ncbi:hypothetical protein AB0I68_02310 [Streptomyces sp. NPDC050448]|uniref:hypothetical protein n=1 Tax=Streptomyces sp. NPDC050448 TaxID=3155404 RepID=UPI00343D7000
MTRPALRTARRAARWPRLLLLAVLLLGIVTMHTLGHPSRSHTMEDAAPVAAVASAGRAAGHASGGMPGRAGADPTGRAPGHTTGRTPGHTTGRTPGHTTGRAPGRTTDRGAGSADRREAAPPTGTARASDAPGPAAGSPLPGTGMDPMSVCLAVLGGFTLLILGAGPAGLRDAAPLGGAARALGRSGGPDPPSPRERLTRLAVLRV